MLLTKNIIKMHSKCRGDLYPFGGIKRFHVPDELVSWSTRFNDYSPPEYESPVLQNKPWADPPLSDAKFKPKWNALDGKINRKSHLGSYKVKNGRPLNPVGRTGLQGRGILGKWGPNHAADPIVTRWKVTDSQEKIHNNFTNKPILQFCAIQRRDCRQWALPGGMVDPGEQVSETLKREFMEEALDSLEASFEQRKLDEEMIKQFFSFGSEIYKGYVDDPRNTDNAWMETVAVNFHDDNGQHVGKFDLRAGDDAANVKWMDIDRSLALYASHSELVKTVVEKLGAHW
ncbi:ADP-ribose pyrophosphatase, mitochondrial isoform X2 [Anthonomus grandis grandis]|nr:ADP-ribose pyrophosphatase, mitochondrial isoform X2 [Anthonomus grandis grandis]